VRIIGRARAWDSRRGLSAEARVQRIVANPPIEQTGNTLRIGNIRDQELQNVSISYEITVPIETRVESRSGSGDHFVTGVRGPIDATAGSGDVRVGQVGGEVRASTGSGDVDVEWIDGPLVVRTGSGSIRAGAVAGPIRARASSGRVQVTQTAAGEVDVTTSSGDITVAGARGPLRLHASSGDVLVEGEMTTRWTIDTSSGSATVRLPGGAAFDLDARSSSGRIRSNHPVTISSGNTTRRRLQGQVRGGGPQLDITTASGSIRIE
jgi:DUF4097 and DUF4098 domain-containing protein YvlB